MIDRDQLRRLALLARDDESDPTGSVALAPSGIALAVALDPHTVLELLDRCTRCARDVPPDGEPRTTPSASEESFAYELLRPAPWSKSPHRHTSELLCRYREEMIAEVLEPVAATLPPREAARVRRAIMVIRGELRIDDLNVEEA